MPVGVSLYSLCLMIGHCNDNDTGMTSAADPRRRQQRVRLHSCSSWGVALSAVRMRTLGRPAVSCYYFFPTQCSLSRNCSAESLLGANGRLSLIIWHHVVRVAQTAGF